MMTLREFKLIICIIGKWQPRYVLTDDSAIEQSAVRKAFPGLSAGEQEVSHLLCTVHSHRTLQRRFASEALKPICQTLRHAMYVYTRPRCQDLCMEAINLAADDKTKTYIRTYWLQTMSKWALYARQHSPMLLQNSTTNACESWPSAVESEYRCQQRTSCQSR